MQNVGIKNLLIHYFSAAATYILLPILFLNPEWYKSLYAGAGMKSLSVTSFLIINFVFAAISIIIFSKKIRSINSWFHRESQKKEGLSNYIIYNLITISIASVPFLLFFAITMYIVKIYGGSMAGILLVLLPIFIFLAGYFVAKREEMEIQFEMINPLYLTIFSILSIYGISLYNSFDLGVLNWSVFVFAILAFICRGLFQAYIFIVVNANKDPKQSDFLPHIDQVILISSLMMIVMCSLWNLFTDESFDIDIGQFVIASITGFVGGGVAEFYKSKSMEADGIDNDIIEAFSFIKGIIAGVVIWLTEILYLDGFTGLLKIGVVDTDVLNAYFGTLILSVAAFYWLTLRSKK